MKSMAGRHLRPVYDSVRLRTVVILLLLSAAVGRPAIAAREAETRILLNAGVVDTSAPEAAARRTSALPAAGKALRLVQFPGPIQPSWYAALEATGVRVVTYIPENAYLVWGTPAQLAAVQRLPDLQWEGEYRPADKVDPSAKGAKGAYSVQLVEDDAENPATLSLVGSVSTKPARQDRILGYVNLRVYAGPDAVAQLASRSDVVSIQPWFEPKKRDERQDMIVSGNLTGAVPSGAGYLAWLASKGFTQAQFTASGFGVDVTDSGVDDGTQAPNHFGLYVGGNVLGTSRVVYNRLEGTANSGSTIQGCDGHGNLNTHIIGGYCDLAGAPFQDGAGYRYGLGVAPFVRLGSSVVFDPGTFTDPDYEDLQSRAYRDSMRVSSNSWGADSNLYDADAQRYDALVRDAQPAGSAVPNAGNQEMVIVFAAGNAGPGAGSVGTPGTAKNVFTSGASENVQAFGAADGCSTADDEADSAMDVASFSSRGPCADGRKKPDLMAPGTHVSGGVAQAAGQQASPPAVATGQALACFDATGVCAGPGTSNYWPLAQQWYTASSGTSHSTPAMAGGAALLRQYFINQGMTPPSPAMTKAYLMNSARYMTGTSANDTLYSNVQGMGLMDLGRAFDGTPRLLDDQVVPANLFTASGQSRTFTGYVADPARPFRVTLAWTDAPGSTTGSAWKNNLDLTVTVGGSAYKGNVFSGATSVTGGSADASNNVESVFLPAGVTGAVTVTVTATNVNSDGVPGNASALDQDFALVVYNACATQPAAPASVSAAATAPNQVSVSFTTNGSPEYRVYRSLVAGGPYTLVGTTASSPWVDAPVSGGLTYRYVVRAVNCAESANSNEATVATTGNCTLPPAFAGVASATNGGLSTCTNQLSWAAATPACGGTVTYSVYRSTTPGFTPAAGNRVASGLTGTAFSDDVALANGTTYSYVVRAVENKDTAVEETNVVEKSARVTGVVTPAIHYLDDFDGNRPANASAYWIATTQSGTSGTMNLTDGCRWQSSSKAYRFGAASTACGGTYPTSTQATLSLGGNGTTAGINGFVLPAGATGSLSFRVWYYMESNWDGAWLAYSTTSAAGPWTNVGDSVVAGAPYISSGGYDNTLRSSSTTRIWTGQNQGANGSLKSVVVNLDGAAGHTVWFAFRFYTDSTINYEGFYVDDVRIDVDSYAVCTTSTPGNPAVGYTVSVPGATAGVPVTATIRAVDSVGATATGYSGQAALSSSDPLAAPPSPVSFTAGVSSPSITFYTPGTRTLTATDTVTPAITGTGSTTVAVGAPAALSFTVPPSATGAGAVITPSVQVAILDAYGNPTASTASVTLAIGTNPGGGTLSGTATVAAVAGVATFPGLSIDKAGTGYTLVANSAGLTAATSASFNVTPVDGAVTLALAGLPATIWAGTPATVTVTAYDAGGAKAVLYGGAATVTSSDLSATLPGPIGFLAGVATFNVTFATLGDQTVTVTDVARPTLTGNATTRVKAEGSLVFHPLTPCRVVDTRNADGTFGGPAIGAAGSPDRVFPLVSAGCGIPAAARAVALNVTVVSPAATGDLLVYADGTTPVSASTLSFRPGRLSSSMAVGGLSTDGNGSVRVRNLSAGTLHVVVDVNGYFAP